MQAYILLSCYILAVLLIFVDCGRRYRDLHVTVIFVAHKIALNRSVGIPALSCSQKAEKQ